MDTASFFHGDKAAGVLSRLLSQC